MNPYVLTLDCNLGRAPGRSHVTGVHICVFLLQLFDGQSHDLLLLGYLVPASILELSVTFEPRHSGGSLLSFTQQGDGRRLVRLAVFQHFNEFMDRFCKKQGIGSTDSELFVENKYK